MRKLQLLKTTCVRNFTLEAETPLTLTQNILSLIDNI